MDSIPMERRTRSGVIPPARWSSSVSCECVVVRRVDGQALCVSHVGEVGEEPEALDESLAALSASLDAEDDHAAEALREIPRGDRVGRIARQAG